MSEHISTTVTTPAAGEPATAAQVIVHGRMESSAELTEWLGTAIGAAREEAQLIINGRILRETLTTVWAAFDGTALLVPGETVQQLVSLSYTDAQALPQSITLNTLKIEATADGTLIYPRERQPWPVGTLPTAVYHVGFSPMPKSITQAICLHCAYKWDNPTGGDGYRDAFGALLAPYKRWSA